MTDIVLTEGRILPMTEAAIARARRLESHVLELPQVAITTHHVLHAGMYARTVRIQAGVVMTGVLVRVPTLLVVNGHVTVSNGDGDEVLDGRNVLAASAHRRQSFVAHEDTDLTMVFTTQAKTIEEAENEFTNEAHLLVSRHADALNFINITGE